MAGKTITDVVGSDLDAFVRDPNTGKERSAEEIVQAILDKGLKEIAPENRGGTTDAQGNFTPQSDDVLAQTILAQIKANAKRNAANTSYSDAVYKELGGAGGNPNIGEYLSDKSKWKYADRVGQYIDRGPEQIGGVVLDRSQKFLSKEELAQYQKIGGGSLATQGLKDPTRFNYIDPVTGYSVDVNSFTGEINWGGMDSNTFINLRAPSAGSLKGNIVSQVKNSNGSTTVTYSDGTTETLSSGMDTSGTSTGATLAVNTFKNTLALFFGSSEMKKPWVDELYKLVNPYYKSGSSIDEALNLAIQEGRNNPNLKEFTSRFKGIYDLQDKLLKGVAVTVPTIAEFIATEAKMGDVLNQAGLSSLNQQSYLGDIIGKGVNVTEFTNRINNVFLRIDQLPQQAKDFISGSFPTLDKTQLAKAILGGDKGAIELSKEIGGLEVQAAFKAQGLGLDTATGLDIASRGFGYQEALTGAGTVAQAMPTYEKLSEISSGKDVKTAQAQKELQGVVFNKSIVDSMRAEQLANQEVARFRSSSGVAGSKSLASQQRGAGLI
jgi:hypothetical protein